MTVVGHRLGYLAFMMWEHEVHASAVDVEALTEIFLAHCRAFKMPSGEAFTPGRWPVHDMFGRGLLPEGEVGGMVFLILAVELAGVAQKFVNVAARQFAVGMVSVEFWHIEIDGSVRDIGIAAFKDLFDVFDLFDDVA